jgi:hypothetical protein
LVIRGIIFVHRKSFGRDFQPIVMQSLDRSLYFLDWSEEHAVYVGTILWSLFQRPAMFSSGWRQLPCWFLAACLFSTILPLLATNSLLTTPPQLTQELPANLSAKLDHQFEKYESGHDYLIERIFNSNSYQRGPP